LHPCGAFPEAAFLPVGGLARELRIVRGRLSVPLFEARRNFCPLPLHLGLFPGRPRVFLVDQAPDLARANLAVHFDFGTDA
jgi:hypothetical protein